MTDEKETTTAVAEQEEFDDTAYAPIQTAWAEEPDSSEDVGFPRMKILQSNSPEVTQEDEPAGNFYVEGFPALGKEVIVVPFLHATTRVMFDQDKQEVECQSPNGKEGFGVPGGECKKCEFSQWGENREKPLCMERKSFVLFIPEIETFVAWDAASTALKTGIRMRQIVRGAGRKGKVAIRMTLNQEKSGKYTYYAPKARMAKPDEVSFDLTDLPTVEMPANPALPSGE